jgi:hypothetical protein
VQLRGPDPRQLQHQPHTVRVHLVVILFDVLGGEWISGSDYICIFWGGGRDRGQSETETIYFFILLG